MIGEREFEPPTRGPEPEQVKNISASFGVS